MSGRGNTTVSSAKNKSKDKQTTRSSRAGLTFPVGRVVSLFLIDYDLRYELIFLQHRYLKQGSYAERIGEGAPVYMGMNYFQIYCCFYCLFLAAVLEYLTAEILELGLVFIQ